MINATINFLDSTAKQYIPTKECIEYCIPQKVIGYHNIEIYSVMTIAGSLILFILFEFLNKSSNESYKKISWKIFYFAKLMIYIFIMLYFLHLRIGV